MKTIELRASEQLLLDDHERGCFVTYHPNFRGPRDADVLFERLCCDTPFEREAPIMFGRAVEVRRRTYSFGDDGIRYRYSGVERVAAPWPAVLLPIVDELAVRLGLRFNYALCQLYPDGEAGIGWHSDDERDIVAGAPIASLSLGAARDFQVRLGKKGGACVNVNLAHGSLLVMAGATQTHYQHQVPKRSRCTSPRVNLTFRLLRGDRRVDGRTA